MPNLRIRLMGGLKVVCAGTSVTTRSSPRLQLLLAYRVLHRATPQTRRQVACLLRSNSSQVHTYPPHLLHALHRGLAHADRFIVVDETMIRWDGDASPDRDRARSRRSVFRLLRRLDPPQTRVPASIVRERARVLDRAAGKPARVSSYRVRVALAAAQSTPRGNLSNADTAFLGVRSSTIRSPVRRL